MDTDKLAARLREIRENSGQTQRQFAMSLGLSHGSVAQWELARKLPSEAVLRRIAAIYQIDTAEFGLGDTSGVYVTDRREKSLLAIWRSLPPTVQNNILDIASIARDAVSVRRKQGNPAPAESLSTA